MKDILFLAHRVPFPPDRGDRIRSLHILRHLAERARVHLYVFADPGDPIEPHPQLRALVASCTIVPRTKGRGRAAYEALRAGLPVSITAWEDPAMRVALATAPAADAVYCFSGQMAQYLPVGGAPAFMDFVDVDSAKFAQLARQGALAMRPVFAREARLLGAWERQVATRVSASLFVSAAEATLFEEGGGRGRITVVENGIDARYFDPSAFPPLTDPRPLIVFTGQMDYAPNIQAVRWLVQQVLPGVRKRHPHARFAIVGRAPTAAVQALAHGSEIVVTGEVPDVRPWLAAAAVCVAPMQLARGVQNKVLEAMAMARPVIASPGAAEGIDHRGTIMVAAGARRWIEAVNMVLSETPGADPIGAQARAQVLRRYDWGARLEPLDSLMGLEMAKRAAA